MDQIKIGKFIASCRKEQVLTQASLAEKFGISDWAVSKWETGKSMPDSGIMLELCEFLKINVNELLSGEHITMENYNAKSEELIPQLDEIITRHAHILTGSTLYSSGGLHDILFLLKSFDLDIRQGYPLGTIFAYGKDDEFKGYSYEADDNQTAQC